MAFINDLALDAALNYVAMNATLIHFCSTEPATYAAVAGASLGSVVPSFAAASDATPNGRRRVVTGAAGTYSANGTVAAYAIVSGSALLATGTLTSSRAVSQGDSVAFSGFDISIADAVSV